MNRDELVGRLTRHSGDWDIIVIGGGATGAGIAVDAASRGYSVVLFEQSDFGKGTSSRSTKLVHGGVRYLAQGHVGLVVEALRERSILLANAPHLVTDLPLVVPAYQWWERAYYGAGLKAYDLLAGRSPFGRSRLLSRSDTLARIPTIQPHGLRGGIEYHDGQFDDARLLVNLLQTAEKHGAVVLNYAGVTGITTGSDRKVDGVIAHDAESGRELRVTGRVVINATGAFVDGVRRMASSGAETMVSPSQGVHLVLDRSFLPGASAIMVPRVGGGRVMFAIPWQGHTLLGTTDTAITEPALEPLPFGDEVDAILATAARYLVTPPTRSDVLSVFVGVRPLVRQARVHSTAALARDHTLQVDPSGLVTITGGKWTTYRHMAERTVDHVAASAGLPRRSCVTRTLRIEGKDDRHEVERLRGENPRLAPRLHEALTITAADVVWAARREMARTVEDVLARRHRALFLNAGAARVVAPHVASLLRQELRRDAAWESGEADRFAALSARYLLATPRA